MKLILAAPSLGWSIKNANAAAIGAAFSAAGFKFKVRPVEGGQIVSIEDSITIELNSLEELIELQRSLGHPIRIEDGYLEVVQ